MCSLKNGNGIILEALALSTGNISDDELHSEGVTATGVEVEDKD